VLVLAAALLSLAAAVDVARAADTPADKTQPAGASSLNPRDRGKYMLIVGSCNDCHTADFAAKNGNVPERDWLKGSALGFAGPWGTTYAPNLRLTLAKLTEPQWVRYAKDLKTRPPMPWFNLSQWTEHDLRAFYRYVRSLGPPGDPAPAFVPPGAPAPQPSVQWPAPPK